MANGPLGLEHPLVCSRDLDQLAAAYRAMGFAPAPKGFHPWGTGTQLVMFPDNFIELMGIEDPSRLDDASAGGFRFGRFVSDFLKEREGVAMVALHSEDARGDLAAVTDRGIPNAGYVDFRRAVRLPDGTDDEAVVSLAMLIDPDRKRLSHFICQQHRPEFVFVPAWQQHPNGADGITRITYAAEDPDAVRPRFAGIWGDAAPMPVEGGFEVATPGGSFTVLAQGAAEERFSDVGLPEGWRSEPCAVAISVRVPEPLMMVGLLTQNGVPGRFHHGIVQVGAAAAGNVVLEFAP